MLFNDLFEKLEGFKCPYDLNEVEVTSNKVKSVCVLIFKHKGRVFDCIVLNDARFDPVCDYNRDGEG